jgi:Clp amino terminal domain, pathogenicity island component
MGRRSERVCRHLQWNGSGSPTDWQPESSSSAAQVARRREPAPSTFTAHLARGRPAHRLIHTSQGMTGWRDVLERAGQEAAGLGHDRIGTEHLLLALAGSKSPSGVALGNCGANYESVAKAIVALPGLSRRHALAGCISDGRVVVPEVQQVIARAEGLAAGLGSSSCGDEHVLVSVLWERGSIVALSVLEQIGVSRTQLLGELERLRVGLPTVPLPPRPRWGPWLPMASGELSELERVLRRKGVLYRYVVKNGEPFVSLLE